MFVVAQRCCVYCITILRLNFEHSGVLMYKCILRFACLNAISKLCPSIKQAYIDYRTRDMSHDIVLSFSYSTFTRCIVHLQEYVMISL